MPTPIRVSRRLSPLQSRYQRPDPDCECFLWDLPRGRILLRENEENRISKCRNPEWTSLVNRCKPARSRRSRRSASDRGGWSRGNQSSSRREWPCAPAIHETRRRTSEVAVPGNQSSWAGCVSRRWRRPLRDDSQRTSSRHRLSRAGQFFSGDGGRSHDAGRKKQPSRNVGKPIHVCIPRPSISIVASTR